MPYLKDERKREIQEDPKKANTDGDYNFLFTLEYLKEFNKHPKYSTIALIRKASLTPSRLEGVKSLEDLLTVQGISQLDRIVARDLAFAEFYRRVGVVYEERARARNGDLTEYEELLYDLEVGK